MRKIELANGEIYHLFNRGVEKRIIFENPIEYQRFILLMRFYQQNHRYQFSKLTHEQRMEVIKKQNSEPLVEIVSYCLMPNHYHLLLKQVADHGITEFIRKISDAYAKYFNKVHERVGPLFQGKFKSVHIENNNQLLQVNRYIHLNPVVSGIVGSPELFQWSSYREYINGPGFCSKDIVLNQFKSPQKYQEFVEDYTDYAKKLHRIEHLVLE